MISVLLYGRNDNYGYNLYKRTAAGLNCLAELMADEDDEILFVDYNTPGHLPTLPEYIWDTLTERALRRVKVIRVPPEIHECVKGDSRLPILENVSRNAAIVRSNPANFWMLSTNPDVVLILSSRWRSLNELLHTLKPSFYELPRFDIPESVWSALPRSEPVTYMASIREWLISNRAAIAETIPDPRFQKFYLFDAPGDFQLAPREYYFRLRGFDQSMNKLLHSDSNLAKRMWLLNGKRTDHLLDHIWVTHQDHYLSGEWAKNASTIVHNDYIKKILHQHQIEANDQDWGLQHYQLSTFRLSDKFRKKEIGVAENPSINGDLPLSQDIDWRTQPFYRLCRYEPHLITLYLRELLQVIPSSSRVAYLGDHAETFEHLRKAWAGAHPQTVPATNLAEMKDEIIAPDLLVVDFYYERTEDSENRIRLWEDKLKREAEQGRVPAEEIEEHLASYAHGFDELRLQNRLVPLWERCFPQVRIRPGTFVVLLGCNTGIGIFFKFKEFISKSWTGNANGHRLPSRLLRYAVAKMPGRRVLPYFHHLTPESQRLFSPLKLQYMYLHHRMVIMRAEG